MSVLLIAEGPSYTFHLYSRGTENEARKEFARAWKRHVKQTGADRDPENAVTINVIQNVQEGTVYRDYEPL